jgi:hypothetical protein
MKGFKPNDFETWPVLLELTEVAVVLRYKNHRTIRALTNRPPEDGGLQYVEVGAGKRKKRMVHRDDLAEFVGRRLIAPPQYHPPTRAKKPTIAVNASSGALARRIADRAGKAA